MEKRMKKIEKCKFELRCARLSVGRTLYSVLCILSIMVLRPETAHLDPNSCLYVFVLVFERLGWDGVRCELKITNWTAKSSISS